VQSTRSGVFPDRNFHVTDPSRMTTECVEEVQYDNRVKNTIAYGSMLLQNRFDDDGRVGGPAVYVMDLRNHNEVLRKRFGDRTWYRFEVPIAGSDSAAVLVPYSAPDSAARAVPRR
jgi:hypothetical protein